VLLLHSLMFFCWIGYIQGCSPSNVTSFMQCSNVIFMRCSNVTSFMQECGSLREFLKVANWGIDLKW
jgi:hypothetical protein